MNYKKRLLKVLLKYKDNVIYNNKKYICVYKDLCKLINYINKGNKLIKITCDIKFYYKILLFLSVFYTDVMIDITDCNIKSNINISNIINKNLDKYFIKINNKIGKIISLKKNLINFNDIKIFGEVFNLQFCNLTKNIKSLNVNNLDLKYLIFFIPLVFINNKKINDKSAYNITNKKFTNKGIYIANNTDFCYPQNMFILYFSNSLNQFLMHNTKIINKDIVGLLFKYIKISKNKKSIFYKSLKLLLPTTYSIVDYKIIIRFKHIRKIDINLSTKNKFYLSKNFSKLLFFKSKNKISKKLANKIYYTLLINLPILNSVNYKYLNLVNYYYYNSRINFNLKNSLFSIIIINNKLIIHLSKVAFDLEIVIFKLINSIINKETININNNNTLIKNNDLLIKKKKNSFNILNELYVLLLFNIKFLKCIILNNIKNNIKNNQNIYYIDYIELTKLKKKASINGKNYIKLFRNIVIKCVYKCFKNYLIFLKLNKQDFLLPYGVKNINIFKKSIYLQYYIKEFIYKLFLDLDKKYIKYLGNFIEIEEILSLNNFNNLSLEKIHISSNSINFPIQISYYIKKKSIIFVVSSNLNYCMDFLIKLIINEINL